MVIALRTMLLCATLCLVIVWPPAETTSTTVAASEASTSSTNPRGNKTVDSCPTSCGNLSVAYPFGIGPDDCSRGPDFRLTCDDSTRPPKLFLRDNITEVVRSIDVASDGNHDGPRHTILTSIWRAIPMKPGVHVYNLTLELPGRSFSRANTNIQITGCDLHVFYVNQNAGRTTWVCSTSCPGTETTETAARFKCSGVGCCQVRVDSVSDIFQLSFVHGHSNSSVTGAALTSSNQTSLLWNRITVSSGAARLAWNIIDEPNCLATSEKQANYACKSKNASCKDHGMTSSDGYVCQCDIGYTGNPYILDGCIRDREYDPNQTKADCTRQCGNVSVQFPFGIEEGCFAREQFHLVCTHATSSSAALELKYFQVISLNINEGLIKYTDPGQQMGAVNTFTGGHSLFIGGYDLVNSMQFVAANLSCIEAQQNISGYACVSTNSRCLEVNAFSGYVGYRCKCSDGFQGNPYIHSGCQGTSLKSGYKNICILWHITNSSWHGLKGSPMPLQMICQFEYSTSDSCTCTTILMQHLLDVSSILSSIIA